MDKTFDCVEMKRKGAEMLRKKLTGLSLEAELKYWQESTQRLKEEQKKLIKKKKSLSKV
jgi:hypothetical protein